MNTGTNKRNSTLDIVRIIAILAVVMIHCSAVFLTNYQQFSNEFFFGTLFDGIARIGVPLFVMISGALFLDERKEVTIKGVLLKNVKSIVIITIVWSVIYSLVYKVISPMLSGETVRIRGIIAEIVNGHYHMWYLYMIIGLYMITPFLKKFVCKENKGMVLFFIAVSFAAQFLLPMADKMCVRFLGEGIIGTWTDKFHMGFFGGYVAYFLAGWYIVHIGIDQKYVRYVIYALGLLSLVFMILYVYFTCDYKTVYEDICAPVFLYSVSVFLAINNIKLQVKEKTEKRLADLSKLTFGVYIIHVILLSVFRKLLPYSEYSVVYILGSFAAVVCVSFLGAYVISKIPVLKKLIKA